MFCRPMSVLVVTLFPFQADGFKPRIPMTPVPPSLACTSFYRPLATHQIQMNLLYLNDDESPLFIARGYWGCL
jgi:hypothetical protein